MHPTVANSRSDFYQTPRLEELASQGMRFYNGYSSHTVCSPTRAALITGQSPAQLQMTELPISVPGNNRWSGHQDRLPLTPPAAEPLPIDFVSLPEIIKQSNPNYTTAHFGKWHIDPFTRQFPLDVGFDVTDDLAPLPPASQDPRGVFKMADAANSFMENSVASGKPFFLNMWEYSVHDPVAFRPEVRDKYAALPPGTIHRDPEYAAMTEDLDTSLGMVLDKIDQLGIRDNTYFIYTSDNGSPTGASSSTPLYRGKASLHEGGIRVPYIISGPGIEAGSFSGVPINTTDLYTTIARLSGYSGDFASQIEGADISPVLHNGGELPEGVDHLERNFHDGGALYWHSPHNFGPTPRYRIRPSSTVRDGDYKLYVEYGENGAPDDVYLYNLATDISQKTNLANSMPTKTAELRTKLNTYLESVDASFAYDVKAPASMNWDADIQGNVPNGWRSTIDLNYRGAETWKIGEGNKEPSLQSVTSFQPGLPEHAYHFNGDDLMHRTFFHVGDDGPRRNSTNVGTSDFNRSASMEFWVRLDSLNNDQVLFESGDDTRGISLTFGDSDGDTKKNDIRFRVLGLAGTNDGSDGTLKDLTITGKLDRYANPVSDFVHVAAIFSDDPNDRYAELYINGARAGRVNGTLGANESLQWDSYDLAGLGNVAGADLGGKGGSGPQPFSGGLRGSVASMRFNNFSIGGEEVLVNYNSVLDQVDAGLATVSGDAIAPAMRPGNVGLNSFESEHLNVMLERIDTLDSQLAIDAKIGNGLTLSAGTLPSANWLDSGTEFSSYLLQFDPTTNNSFLAGATGTVDFEGDILGVIWDQQKLAASDSVVGSIGNYGNAADRGLDFSYQNSLTIASDLRSLSFDLETLGTEMLQFRILTTVGESNSGPDFNGDGYVDIDDLDIWQGAVGVSTEGDADGDGDTDGRDFLMWQRQFAPDPLPSADFNNDQLVDNLDLNDWQMAYGQDDSGDADGDGDTDGHDFLTWQQQTSTTSLESLQAVPEPSGLALLLIGSLALCSRRRLST